MNEVHIEKPMSLKFASDTLLWQWDIQGTFPLKWNKNISQALLFSDNNEVIEMTKNQEKYWTINFWIFFESFEIWILNEISEIWGNCKWWWW